MLQVQSMSVNDRQRVPSRGILSPWARSCCLFTSELRVEHVALWPLASCTPAGLLEVIREQESDICHQNSAIVRTTDVTHLPSDCSKFSRGSQKDWYRRLSSSSASSMLPPRHSVTLNPSSLSSPVNSRLTPFSVEPHSAWIRRHAVSSEMIVPKWRVLSPVEDVSVLPCIGSQIQATGWPDCWTAVMCAARCCSTCVRSRESREEEYKVQGLGEVERTFPAP